MAIGIETNEAVNEKHFDLSTFGLNKCHLQTNLDAKIMCCKL